MLNRPKSIYNHTWQICPPIHPRTAWAHPSYVPVRSCSPHFTTLKFMQSRSCRNKDHTSNIEDSSRCITNNKIILDFCIVHCWSTKRGASSSLDRTVLYYYTYMKLKEEMIHRHGALPFPLTAVVHGEDRVGVIIRGGCRSRRSCRWSWYLMEVTQPLSHSTFFPG